jgi:hypothetical protein
MHRRTRDFLRLLTAITAFACLAAAPAQAGRRVALVIGNSSYANVPPLPNPRGDAAAIAGLLQNTGFDNVTLKTDLDFNAMRLAFRDFGLKAHGADVAAVYFAGHGLELGGENYLVPVDARLASDSSVGYEAITLSLVLSSVRPAKRLRLVILDACRNNPFSQQMKISGGRTRSVSRGLARIEPPGDVLVAYSAKAGTTARDGAGAHSPYAEALLAHLATPGLDIRLVMGAVRDAVIARTRPSGTPQEPFIYGSLGGQRVYLAPPRSTDRAQPGPAAQAAPPPPPAPDPAPDAKSLWSHNGSAVYLVAKGAARRFYYWKPRPGMLRAGARPGDLLFEGTRKGAVYEGAAYVFSSACGAVPYEVSGLVSPDERRVTMRGEIPTKYDEACHPMRFRDDELVFEFIGAGGQVGKQND